VTVSTFDPIELNAQIVESAEVAILTLNSEGVVTSWNASAQRFYDHTAKAVIGRNFTMLTSPDVQLDHVQRLRCVNSGQRIEAFTTRHTHQFGHWLNVRIQIGALTNSGGEVIGATLFVVPRSAHTELRASIGGTRTEINSATDFALEALGNANLDLFEARAQIKLLLQAHADTATLTVDLDGRVKTWSSAAWRVLGYAAEQIVGQPMEMLYPPEERVTGRPQRALEMAALHGRCEEEAPRMREDGSRFWARRIIAGLRDESGRLVGYAKVIQDLTDTQQLHAKLQRLESGFGDAPDAVLLTDADFLAGGPHIVYANDGFEQLRGYPFEELIGRTPRLLQGADWGFHE
jgi:PAS domain S-box-containing protein